MFRSRRHRSAIPKRKKGGRSPLIDTFGPISKSKASAMELRPTTFVVDSVEDELFVEEPVFSSPEWDRKVSSSNILCKVGRRQRCRCFEKAVEKMFDQKSGRV